MPFVTPLNPIIFWPGILLVGGEGDTLPSNYFPRDCDPFEYAPLPEGEGLTLFIMLFWSTLF
jgi:hypothetical protein